MTTRATPRVAAAASRKLDRRALVCLALAVAAGGVLGASSAHADTPEVAEFRVVINARNPQDSIARDFLADAFLKKVTRWDDGEPIRPCDLRLDSTVRRAFSKTVLRRAIAAIRSYWQQRIFSGRDVPPPELDSDEAVLRYVAKYRGAVGYVSAAAHLGDGVKAVRVD